MRKINHSGDCGIYAINGLCTCGFIHKINRSGKDDLIKEEEENLIKHFCNFYFLNGLNFNSSVKCPIKITVIRCFEEKDKKCIGDYVSAIYINGTKIINGDEYHNKINNKLEGMEILLKHLNIGYEIKHENIFLPEEEMWEWQGEEKLKD